MKKLISLLLAVCMLLSLTACININIGKGKQTATDTFRIDGKEIVVTVDVSGGWSVEFTTADIYLYEGENDPEREADAYGRFIDKEEYDKYAAEYSSLENIPSADKEVYDEYATEYSGIIKLPGVDVGIKIDEGEGGVRYLYSVDEDVYFMISVSNRKKAEEIFKRFDVKVETAASGSAIDYLALVNKLNPLPEGWEEALETVTVTNSVGDEVEVEKKAYDAYLKLKDAMEAEDIYLELDSARRSIAAQQDIMDRFIEKYGAAYAAKTVAKPGYSEHHTGLALDLYFRLDGKDVYYNEDMVQYPEVWEKIHAKLADYGFILRYLEGKEHITGYGYEPWHIRYIDSIETAKEIMSEGITLEGYLGAVNETDVAIDYGSSELYGREELEEVAVQIKCSFASWEGCELHSLRYAGDECSSEENLEWMNSINKDAGYTQVVEFLGDFHSPKDAVGAWEPDREYTDYQWWAACTEDGSWDIVTWGY